MDDFPVDGTDEEKTRYIKKKTLEMYHYKKLTGNDGGRSYRESENVRVKDYNKRKKRKTAQMKPAPPMTARAKRNNKVDWGT